MKRAIAIVLLLALAGCGVMPGQIPGVKASDEERAECAASQDCTVWTKDQLQRLIQFVWNKAQEAAKGNRL